MLAPANAFFRMRVSIFLICLAYSLSSSNPQVADARSGRIIHAMLFWPKQSFGLGVVVILRDREALEKFEHSPRREGALDATFRSLFRRYAVYSLANE